MCLGDQQCPEPTGACQCLLVPSDALCLLVPSGAQYSPMTSVHHCPAPIGSQCCWRPVVPSACQYLLVPNGAQCHCCTCGTVPAGAQQYPKPISACCCLSVPIGLCSYCTWWPQLTVSAWCPPVVASATV